MARLILKCPYLKGGAKSAAHLDHLVKYIATRDGVEKVIPEGAHLLPASQKQQSLVTQLLSEFPNTKELFEYEDYLKIPTRENASEFITIALEQNLDQALKREHYVDYIAMRPRVEMRGAHGLFTGSADSLVLSQIAKEVSSHTGNVWTPIISLRREDAAHLGYDNADAWRTLLSSKALEIADCLKIHPDHFRWYASFHNEAHHPHVHMICYSTDPKEGYLTKTGIANMKSSLVQEIFQQDLLPLYAAKSEQRDQLIDQSTDVLRELIRQMRTGMLQNSRIEQLVLHLADRLRFTSGKKQYGYLKAPLKNIVDEIVDELAQDSRVLEAYRIWTKLHNDVMSTYTDNTSAPLPLSKQKEFKSIRNMVIQEALRVESMEFTFEDSVSLDTVSPDPADTDTSPPEESAPESDILPEDFQERSEMTVQIRQSSSKGSSSWWSEQYQQARVYLFGSEAIPQNFEKALKLLRAEAVQNNPLAMFDLGRMTADGLGCETDAAVSHDWYRQALMGFLATEQDRPWKYIEYRIGKMLRDGIGCEVDSAESGRHFRDAFLGFSAMEQQSQDDKLQYRLGWMLLHGVGTEKDLERAKQYFEKAATVGNVYACYQLAKLTLADDAASPEAIMKAISHLTLASENGNPFAQYALAKLYRDGGRIERNIAEAIRLFILAADQGNEHAQYALGKLYLSEQQIESAIHWFTLAADQGNSFASYQLGKLYLTGNGTPKSIESALRYLTEAAEQNNPLSQYILGKLYLLGQDVPKDKTAAIEWFTRSAAQGNIYAQFFLDHIDNFSNPSVALSATRLLRHLSSIFADITPLRTPPGLQIDRKRRRELNRKKQAQGHAADDHEPTMSL